MSQTFMLEFWQEEGWYIGRLKGVPGVFSQGKTMDKLKTNIRDAYRSMVEDEEHAPEGAQTKSVTVEV